MLNVVVVGYVWPEPNSSAAGQNMLSIIERCLAANFNVTFLTAATDSEHKADLLTMGVNVQPVALNCSSFNALIAEIAPDVVIFDRYMTEEQFSWRVKEVCPNALRVLNTEDLHSLRQARHEAVKKHGDASLAHLHSELAQREIASIIRSDLTLIISKKEMVLLTEHYGVPSAQLQYHPLVVGRSISSPPPFEQRSHFIHIGNFRHAPNWDAVLQLKQHLWPSIKKALPHAELHIYGAYPPKKATQLHNEKQGFLVKGWANDVESVMMNARALIAPLRFGAGIKGKLLDAMRCGTPSITTWIGAEGIAEDSLDVNSDISAKVENEGENLQFAQWPGALCDADTSNAAVIQNYVERAVALYEDEKVWSLANKHTVSLINEFKQQQPEVPLIERISELKEGLNKHRDALFMQSMLWHQTLAASKYMSQWIEAKNK
ncbi:glycosyltransferase [Alteromonas macleodii]|uniref:Glycosyltransferase, family GT4 n=1 Tax=Alteromonas macleodii TaxID=28108 RepID=A0A6T9XXQ5_ALTMA|nr:glycosyltransferase [Alteromonas macleodii]CAB9493579.1 Glycosyltransferase, family GT4 [Alteromonas macleodii]